MRRAVVDRISPRLLALRPEADLDSILPMLEKDGVFLESDVTASIGTFRITVNWLGY